MLAVETSIKDIAVGVSHHPRGVMPISGMFSGDAGDYISMTAPVKVKKILEGSEVAVA